MHYRNQLRFLVYSFGMMISDFSNTLVITMLGYSIYSEVLSSLIKIS